MSSDMEGKLQIAWAVSGRLHRNGFAVLAVHAEAGQRRPTIDILRTADCSELNGIPTCEVDDDGKPQHWTVAVVGGCRVRWRAPHVSLGAVRPVFG